jgi:hypothetical protein
MDAYLGSYRVFRRAVSQCVTVTLPQYKAIATVKSGIPAHGTNGKLRARITGN